MAYEIVMTAKDFCEGLKVLPFTLKGSIYKNIFPQNCLYNQGNGIFSADCWNLVKAFIWGKGTLPKNKGEYVYKPGTFGLGDWDGAKLMSCCSDVSTDFSKLTAGEGLLTQSANHWGTYVGDWTREWQGKTYTWNVIECTPIWENGIQATYVDAQGKRLSHKGGSQAGAWYKHGKLPWIDYEEKAKTTAYTVDVEKSKYNQIVVNLK